MPFTVALDRCTDDPREFIERAKPTHPSVVDTGHLVAELFHIVNVPTMIWIDERGRVCRPHDAQFGTDTFRALTGKSSGVYLDMIRAWVKDGRGALSDDEVRSHQPVPTAESQLARARQCTLVLQLDAESGAGRPEPGARADAGLALELRAVPRGLHPGAETDIGTTHA